MTRKPVFLGVDVGGSHTTVVVGDHNAQVVARADGPGSAMRPGGAESSAAVIADVARRAAAAAEVTLPADAAMVGAAGAGREAEQQQLAAALIALDVARRVRVAGDGSIAFARSPDARLHRAGGYGWQLGDEGGGYWLGRRALAAGARATDDPDESSTLLERLLVALGLRHLDDLIRWTATATPAQVAALAPHVLNAAREGEAVARRAVGEAAVELARLVEVLGRHFPGAEPIAVATAGGLLRPGSPLLQSLHDVLAADMPRAHLKDGPVDAPAGAVRLAAQLI